MLAKLQLLIHLVPDPVLDRNRLVATPVKIKGTTGGGKRSKWLNSPMAAITPEKPSHAKISPAGQNGVDFSAFSLWPMMARTANATTSSTSALKAIDRNEEGSLTLPPKEFIY